MAWTNAERKLVENQAAKLAEVEVFSRDAKDQHSTELGVLRAELKALADKQKADDAARVKERDELKALVERWEARFWAVVAAVIIAIILAGLGLRK